MIDVASPAETGSPEREPFRYQRMVEYRGGEVDLSFSHVGDTIAWREHKYADPERNQADRVLVRTKSGNTYVVADGLIINTATGGVFEMEKMPDRLPDVVIGKPWDVQGVGATSDVTEVLLRYKIDPGTGETMIDSPSPFVNAEKWLEAAHRALEA